MNDDTSIKNVEIIPEKDYVLFDEDGLFLGFYNNKVHSIIPNNAIEISYDIKNYILEQTKKVKVKDISLPITTDNIELIEEDPIQKEPTALEKLRADVDFLMIMEGYGDV